MKRSEQPTIEPTIAGAARDERAMRVMKGGLQSMRPRRFLRRLRYQLTLGLLVAVIAPTFVYNLPHLSQVVSEPSSMWTLLGTLVAFLASLYLFRRVATFPGLELLVHVLPTSVATYGTVVATFFALRLDYSRLTFFASFAGALLFLFIVGTYLRRRQGHFYLVPSPTTEALTLMPSADWVMLTEPRMPREPHPIFIADLRADLSEAWERLIADAAVAGHPVYHVKQIQESLTGRVEIEHLSENSFGSLIPNLNYRSTKRIIDLVSALLLLPTVLLVAVVVGIIIKVESPGPVFFRQKRRGYRGTTFKVMKFRTMRHDHPADEPNAKDLAITRHGDARITRFGRFLRRTRIDELPQVWNVILGEMSWIGPRPEALPLSDWYTAELPFYNYRHIVRPGITGWAQVNQGHVADLEAVNEKLHYDFYYIKNFSASLDLFILGKTLMTVLTGFGAR